MDPAASAQVRVPRALGSALTSLFPWELGGVQGTVGKLSASPFQSQSYLAKSQKRKTLRAMHASRGLFALEASELRCTIAAGGLSVLLLWVLLPLGAACRTTAIL